MQIFRRSGHVPRSDQLFRPHGHVLLLRRGRPRSQVPEVPVVEEAPHRIPNGLFRLWGFFLKLLMPSANGSAYFSDFKEEICRRNNFFIF